MRAHMCVHTVQCSPYIHPHGSGNCAMSACNRSQDTRHSRSCRRRRLFAMRFCFNFLSIGHRHPENRADGGGRDRTRASTISCINSSCVLGFMVDWDSSEILPSVMLFVYCHSESTDDFASKTIKFRGEKMENAAGWPAKTIYILDITWLKWVLQQIPAGHSSSSS